MPQKTYVFYHGNCYDGFTAAWAVWCSLNPEYRDDEMLYEFVPCLYTDPRPDICGCRVIIVDFSWGREDMEWLIAHNDVLVLDHHKSAEANLRGLPNCFFDMDRSGAMMAWEHFHLYATAPKIVQYAQDRDLWKFALPDSEEISAWMRSLPFEFSAWDSASAYMESDFAGLAQQGVAILGFQSQLVENMARTAWDVEIGGYKVKIANASVFFSEVAAVLAPKSTADFGAYVYEISDGLYQYGLRGGLNSPDLSKIAARYGGGGHAKAAGFTLLYPIHHVRVGEMVAVQE